jgi:hypothetical protein
VKQEESMIKLFSLKQEKEAAAQSSAAGEKKVAPGLIRMQKGVCSSFGRPHPFFISGTLCAALCCTMLHTSAPVRLRTPGIRRKRPVSR